MACSLFLTPRFDQFRIAFPKELIPDEIHDKWYNELNKDSKNFFREPIDIINESIQSIEITGINDGGVEQEQTGRNLRTGRVEPSMKSTYRSSANPVDLMNNEITVTFRHTQGFYTYFLLFESWFYHHAKDNKEDFAPYLAIEILGEGGKVINHIILRFPVFNSIDSLNLSFNKVERQSETFNCTFKYSDIDFEFGPVSENTNLEQ